MHDAVAGSIAPASPATDDRLYRTRDNAFRGETVWWLAPGGLESYEQERLTMHVPYSEITAIRLSFDPTRFDTARYRCTIDTWRRLTVVIPSTSYISLGSFEDRAATYTPFVRRLIGAVATASPVCAFHAGRRPWVYLAEHAFLLAMALLLVLVLGLVGGVPLFGLAALKLAIIALYIPLLVRSARRNWPRDFAPGAIPPDVLPGA